MRVSPVLFVLILCPFIVWADECTPDSPPGISANEGVLEMCPGNGNATIHGNLTVLGEFQSSVPSERELMLLTRLSAAEEAIALMREALTNASRTIATQGEALSNATKAISAPGSDKLYYGSIPNLLQLESV